MKCNNCNGTGNVDDKINNLFVRIEDILNLSNRVKFILKAENFIFLGDLVAHQNLRLNNKEYFMLCRSPNFGNKSYKELLNELFRVNYDHSIISPEYWEVRRLMKDCLPEYLI